MVGRHKGDDPFPGNPAATFRRLADEAYLSWRPHNETAEDLRRERIVADRFGEKFSLIMHKLSETLYGVDFAMVQKNGIPRGLAEVKIRYSLRDKYPTLKLGLAKWDKLLRWGNYGASLLIVQWEDTLRYVETGKVSVAYGILQRRRGQNGDTEPCVDIPINAFETVIDGPPPWLEDQESQVARQ